MEFTVYIVLEMPLLCTSLLNRDILTSANLLMQLGTIFLHTLQYYSAVIFCAKTLVKFGLG